MSPTTIILLVILVSIAVSMGLAGALVRSGKRRAEGHLAEIGPIERTVAATSLGVEQQDQAPNGTGTLALSSTDLAFAQWRPDRFLRIARSSITAVDTTRTHMGRTMKSDVLRVRFTDQEAGESAVAFFVRDLDGWLATLGGTRSPEPEPEEALPDEHEGA